MEIDPAWLDLGLPPDKLASYDEQERLIEAAAAAGPISAANRETYKNGGIAADCLGRHSTALRCWAELIKLNDNDHEAHYEAGCQQLMLGHYPQGWQEYLHHYRTEAYIQKAKDFPPIWNGQASGDGIFVFADQGYGDSIMAMRYVPALFEKFKRAIFFCDASLAPLAQATGFFEDVVSPDAISRSKYGSIEEMGCQYHVPVLALPAHFRAFDPAPPPAPGYFKIHPDVIKCFRNRFAGRGGVRVGVAWRGKPSTPRDPLRSFDPKELQPLTQIPNTSFFAIQWDAEDLEIEDLGPGVIDLWPHMRSVKFGGRPWSLLETAAFVAGLDLVVTCDSVIAHVAGAMNVRTWVALPLASEWRWGVKTTQSPWYPDRMTLYRQTEYRVWDDVFAAMAADLTTLVESNH